MKVFPEDFLNRAKKFAGIEYDSFMLSLDLQPPVAVRLNPFKRSSAFEKEESIPWSRDGRYLPERPSFTLDPHFHAGCYYVQDASSQFLENAFIQAKKTFTRPVRILDLCAAPGGKSTHILSMIGDEDLLVSNEIIASRNNILRHNIVKWGRPNAIVTQNNPQDFTRLGNFFDIIVIDAPCSGEGLFRKDSDAIGEWSEENVKRCALRQVDILKSAFEILNPGGFIIYSTCTFEAEENDDPIDHMIKKTEMVHVPIESTFEGIVKTKFGLAFYPHRVHGEGFYISMVQKSGVHQSLSKKDARSNDKIPVPFSTYLKDAESFFPVTKEEKIFAIPREHVSSFNELNKNLYVRMAGIYVGDEKGKDFNPSSELALSGFLKSSMHSRELDANDAIKFLRGESIEPEGDKGWQLMCYKGFNLGWIKNLGNRTNNYYPKEWRIRKSYDINNLETIN